MSSARQTIRLPEPLDMRLGGQLAGVELAYETWGELNARRDNALVIFTGLSPDAHAASSEANPAPGWWEEMIGPGKPIDTDRYHVICFNSLGSCFGSTGPASLNPATGRPWRLDFPMLTVEDIATSAHAALRAMGITRPRALVGPSLGGMTALAYALLYPNEARELVLISSAAQALPFAIAIRSLQRECIRDDPRWKDGYYAEGEGPVQGMRLARKIGVMSYRSAEEWKQRFGRDRVPAQRRSTEPFGIEFEIESYLEAHAEKFVGSFDANCYLYLSHAMDLFDAAEHGDGSLEKALGSIQVERALVIGVVTDFLFPPEQQREMADLLRRGGVDVTHRPLDSLQGHDSFLVDIKRFGTALRSFLQPEKHG
ncbi:MAG: homoserine O-acetyltransferase [Gammaproteobacteria bacterium]|jgi:homoserine O-acetyltransferase